MGYIWQTRSFQLAPPGWTIAVLFKPEEEPRISVMPGWLVQEEVFLNGEGTVEPELDSRGEPTPGSMRVIGGRLDGGQIEAGDDAGDICIVLPPGEELAEEDIQFMREQARQRVSGTEARRAAADAQRDSTTS